MSMLTFLIVCGVCLPLTLCADTDSSISCYSCALNQTDCAKNYDEYAKVFQPCSSATGVCYQIVATKSGGGWWYERGCASADEDGKIPTDDSHNDYKSYDGVYEGTIYYCAGKSFCNAATTLARFDIVKVCGISLVAILLAVSTRFA